jgi:hypothetical protein
VASDPMIEVTFPVDARGFLLAPRTGGQQIPYLPFMFLIGLALWSSTAAMLHPILYADIFSRL